MGRVIAFNPKNGPVHEEVNKEPSGIGAELNLSRCHPPESKSCTANCKP
jgi:hypothetical protein